MTMLTRTEIIARFRHILQGIKEADSDNFAGQRELDIVRNTLEFSISRLRHTDATPTANDNPPALDPR
ncbi:hypothetical protein [Phyllobacterium sp. YR531]|uniref:hypothetical protein n=1 Tax=Phyllobacterium sp. YR531 TaxID=1144343 RepID=UPI0005939BB9|nr:hypothetical protein [Phyllobacterium sp. YR531]